MKKKTFVANALILTGAALIAKVLGAIYRIPLTNILGGEGVGYYQLVFPMYALFFVITSAGIPIALSKIIADNIAKKDYTAVKKIFSVSKISMLIIGSIFAVLVCVLSFSIANLQQTEMIYILYIVIAPSIIFSSMLSVYRGYYQGLQNMTISGISQVVEQLIKVAFGLTFSYLLINQGVIYGALGAVLGVTLSEIVAFLYIRISYAFTKSKENFDYSLSTNTVISTSDALKRIFEVAFPITLCSCIIPLASVIDSLLIIRLLSNSGLATETGATLFGYADGVVGSLISFPTIISVSFASALVPAISSSLMKSNRKNASKQAKFAILIVWLISLPATIVLITMGKDIISILYSGSSTDYEILVMTTMLIIGAISVIYLCFSQILVSFLQGLNKSYTAALYLGIGAIIKVLLTIILVQIPVINIYGMLIADIFGFSTTCLLALKSVQKKINLSYSFKQFVIVPLIGSVVLFGLLRLYKDFSIIQFPLLSVIVIIFALMIYSLILINLNIFSEEDLSISPKLKKILYKVKIKK